MITNCEICKTEIEVKSQVCCTGYPHSIECACGGSEIIESTPVCSKCREVLEYLNEHNCNVESYENGKPYTIYTDDLVEEI